MDLLMQDVRYAVRRLAASPLFALMAILIVGVGIAANTTVFSVVNAVLLRPLPFANADRVMHVYQDSDEGAPESSSFPAYRAIAERRDVFASAAAVFNNTVTAETNSGIRQSFVEFASASYFPVLGLSASQGRWFSPEEDVAGVPATAVVSDHAWRTRFGADPNMLGRTMRLGGSAVTIVGIGPRDYNGIVNGTAVDFWLPLAALGPVAGSFAAQTLERPQDHWFQIRARLRDGVSVEQARAAMTGVSNDLAGRFAGLDQKRRISVLPARAVRIHPSFDGSLVPAAVLLMTVVGLVLVLVCSNLAILLLLRGAGQHRAVSIRMAMGAGRGRIARQFLTESLVLSLAGGIVGVVAAQWLVQFLSRTDLPVPYGLIDASIDYRVLAFVTALSLITGVAFGMAPAMRAMRTDMTGAIVGIAAEKRHVGVKYGMVGFQVALSLVLLAGTGLVIRSMMQMERVDIGFNRDRLTFVTTSAFQAGYTPPNAARVYRDIADRLTVVPGVQSVVSTNRLPLGRGPTNTLVIEGYVSPTGTNTTEVSSAAVSANYFDALGIRILHGRAFRPQDNFTAPPVAIVSEAMARRYWGTSDVVGRRYSHDGVPDSSVEIVGVVKDVKVTNLTEEPRPQFYRPLDQQGGFLVSYIVRSTGDQSVMPGTLSRVVREVDAKLPVLQATTIEDYLTQQLLIPRIGTTILAGFSLTALILAALGLYAVVAFAVGERAREVGIRMALGARGPHVVWMTVRGVMMTVAAGLVVGLVLSIAAAQGMSNVLYRVSPTDPVTLGVVTLVLGLVALVAALIPARRATRVNPLVVLRYQ
jgi:putative ABC transport system permease protein